MRNVIAWLYDKFWGIDAWILDRYQFLANWVYTRWDTSPYAIAAQCFSAWALLFIFGTGRRQRFTAELAIL